MTLYLLPETDVTGAISTNWSSIWDAGGSDTLEYDGSGNAILDLRAATLDDLPTGGGILSYAAFIHGGFTIANGVVIEKAVGGSGNDSITGNSAGNTFKGRGGDDTIEGGAGTDTAIMAGLRSSYTVTDLGNAQLHVVGPDGTDTLTNVERLQFDDAFVTYEIRVNDLDGDSVTFTEGGSAVHLDAGTAATVTDSDPADFNVSKLTVSITANKVAGEDLLGIDTSGATTVTLSAGLTAGSTVSVGATAIGTIAVNGDGANGHDLIVIFNANATPARVGALLDALTYSDSNQADPSTLPRTVAVTLDDDDGATSTAANVTVDVVAVNDAPVATADAATITEDTAPNLVTGDAADQRQRSRRQHAQCNKRRHGHAGPRLADPSRRRQLHFHLGQLQSGRERAECGPDAGRQLHLPHQRRASAARITASLAITITAEPRDNGRAV